MSKTVREPSDTEMKNETTSRRTQGGDFRLQGKGLLVARVAWIVLIAFSLVSFATGIPDLFATVGKMCPDTCAFVPQQAHALANIGISMDAYAWIVVTLSCVVLLISLAMALLVFWRRSDDWMALIVAFFLVALPLGNISALNSSGPLSSSLLASLIIALLNLPFFAVFYGAFLIFPSGRFVPRWSWILLLLWLFDITAITLQLNIFDGLLYLGYPLLYGSAILCQLYRFWRHSTPVQRQQTKWVVCGLIASLLANQIFWQTSSLPSLSATVYGPFVLLFYLITLLLLPTTFFVAIQRYRLYDIDVVIRRTLIYGSLTAILALVYIGGIIGLQALINLIAQSRGGEGFSPPVIVITTLLIAALFQPLRSRIQRAVDRRFYRGKYDARHAIEQFGASLRQQVDLPALTSQLVTVVQETMQPTDISLWLSEKGARSPERFPT